MDVRKVSSTSYRSGISLCVLMFEIMTRSNQVKISMQRLLDVCDLALEEIAVSLDQQKLTGAANGSGGVPLNLVSLERASRFELAINWR